MLHSVLNVVKSHHNQGYTDQPPHLNYCQLEVNNIAMVCWPTLDLGIHVDATGLKPICPKRPFRPDLSPMASSLTGDIGPTSRPVLSVLSRPNSCSEMTARIRAGLIDFGSLFNPLSSLSLLMVCCYWVAFMVWQEPSFCRGDQCQQGVLKLWGDFLWLGLWVR